MNHDSAKQRAGHRLKTVALTALGGTLIILHQDFWNWHAVRPLIFGLLPIGLAYQAAYSVACAFYMGLLVKFLWPAHLERLPEPATPPNDSSIGREGGGH